MTINLKNLIKQLCEAVLDDLSDVQCAPGSTHILSTCKINQEEYFLKYSDDYNFDTVDPSLQILIEYLAYNIYSLYPGIRIPPKIHLVYDNKNNRVGIATSKIKGSPALYLSTKKDLAKGLSAGVFVDIFLANWDVVGMGDGNILVNDKEDEYTRIDPGGALTFRAQGGRKNRLFNQDASELNTMLDPGFGGSGSVYQYADLKQAAEVFNSVPFEAIQKKVLEVDENIKVEIRELQQRFGNQNLFSETLKQWQDDLEHILPTLEKRYKNVMSQVNFILKSQ